MVRQYIVQRFDGTWGKRRCDMTAGRWSEILCTSWNWGCRGTYHSG